MKPRRDNPSEKQAGYIFYLLNQAGYSTRWMDARFKDLGATMRERSGRVEDWVRGLNMGEASRVIDKLLAEVAGKTNPRSRNPRHGTARDIPARWTPATVKRLKGGRIQVKIGGRRKR